MALYLVPLSFVLGLIFGSFANVVILRWGTGRSIAGRSSCPACGHVLGPLELIPVVSYIALRGRCKECGTKISPQYALVELTFAILFAIAACYGLATFPGMLPVAFIIYAWINIFLLVSIAVYDIRHFIIPDGLVYAYMLVGFVWGMQGAGWTLQSAEHLLAAGALTALPLFLLWAISAGKWMGFGDIKLALGMGIMLGVTGGVSALIFGIWLGAIISLVLIGFKRLAGKFFPFAPGIRHFTMKSEIPFGPFLIAGTFIVFFSHLTLLSVMGLM